MIKSPYMYIMPHGGGTSYAYRVFADGLGPEMDTYCYDFPGHGSRAQEATVRDMEILVADFFTRMEHSSDRPWVLFGHSMGALLAHAIVLECDRKGKALPEHLVVSGTAAPAARKTPKISHLPKELFWNEIGTYGGIAPEILQSQELMDYFETILRSDFEAVERYKPERRPLKVPVTVLYGQDDMSREDAESWRSETDKRVRISAFPGNHFYLFENVLEVCKIVKHSLTE